MVTGMVIKYGKEADPEKRLRQKQGERIRRARKLRGMSINELAEALDVTPGAVSQWEIGLFSPRQSKQIKIAKALDVEWSFLFSLDDAA